MFNSKKKFSAGLAALILMIAGAGALAQRHFMLAITARPEVNVQLAGFVERDSKRMPLDKSTIVNPGEILDWTIDAENGGNAPALEYKTVGHIPRGTEYVANSAKADGARTVFSIDGGKSYSPQPTIEEKQADGSIKRVNAPASMYTEIRYEWTEPLAQAAKLSAAYQVRVK